MAVPQPKGFIDDEFINVVKILIDHVNEYGKTIQDLVADGQLTDEQYSNLILTINGMVKSGEIKRLDLTPELREEVDKVEGKIDKGQVSVRDINKNLGKFDQTYMDDEFLQQMAGTTPINSVPADDSITLKKLAFSKTGKNLFDKNATHEGYYIHLTTGDLSSNDKYTASDYIQVQSNTDYAFSSTIVHLAWYDADKILIHTRSYPNVLNSPDGAVFVRVSVNTPDVDDTQVEQSSARTSYEPYRELIPAEITERHELSTADIPDGSLGAEKMTFMEPSKNLFNKKTITAPGIISPTNGKVVDSQSYNASDFISVDEGEQYHLSGTRLVPVRIGFYDGGKAFISAISEGVENPITIPETAEYIRFSFYQGDEESIQFEKGASATSYEAYGYKLPYERLGSSEVTDIEIVLPPVINAVVGKEISVYFDQTLSGYYEDYYFAVDCDIGRHQKERWMAVPDSPGSYELTVELYNKNYNKLSEDTTTVVVAENTAPLNSQSALFVGSSTTASGTYTNELLNMYADINGELELIGTQGSGSNRHEGHGGWRFSMFHESSSSPFVFNGVFDFSQYLSANSFAVPNYVFFHCGINDVFSSQNDGELYSRNADAVSHMNAMISKIHSSYPDIKIGIILSYPTADQDGYARDYGTEYQSWRYKRNAYLAVRGMYDALENRESENVYIVPAHTNIDTRNNMPDEEVQVNSRNTKVVTRQSNGIHMATSGYYQFADAVYYWLLKNI